ncbi:MAG TPA: trypsin-like peptidase domain-containing protein [Micromonosporaceae bacterium]|jgi:putative serine protease PepD
MSENQANPAGADPTGELPATGVPGHYPDPAVPAATSGPTPAPPEPPTGMAASPAGSPVAPDDPGGAYRVPQAPPPAYPPATVYPPTAAQPTTAQPYPTTAQPYPGAAQTYPTGAPPYGLPQPAASQPGKRTLAPPVRRGLIAGVAALAIALGGGAVGGFVGYAMHPDTVSSPLQITGNNGNGNAAPVVDRANLASIAAAMQPTIVDIQTDVGEGSGVVISADGYIVTNNHVTNGARTVQVTFNSGQQVTADVIGADAETDIAVVKVDANNLVFAKWGDSDAIQIGDTVLAMGSPLGLQGTVTAGIISGLHRTITSSDNQRSMFDQGNATVIGDAIQTDAPINEGNSGGALVDTNGEVIGINTAIATAGTSGNIGVGFAITSNKAKAVAQTLIAGKSVNHPYLGVQVSDAPSGGAKIESVVDGSAAASAGLQAGDVVTKFGDRTIRTADDLLGAVQSATVGSQVSLTVNRGADQKTLTVTIGQK